jgi:hypothetical protein
MSANQLDLLPADQAATLLRKRFFWTRTLWISLVLGVLLALSAVSGTVIRMMGAFLELEKTGAADPAELAGDISEAMLVTLWSLPPACLAFVVTMVSFICLLSLPKAP